ncbi:thiol-disulfide oxidoreductase DCC family protein [Agrilutibacter solisilvae]|uniref:Thiol-disulfide oxidoreductase DCC family protein n=1 Tax=Agrilutibacter solisilvae TaxID=2763317 RepID=A0A974Y0V8_9GAMM|nr:thiol-disulfide oxidoreductase DCC family protein [Lysobacter solisilvae]QSX78530.1 thiol-disulfide oxidoreductase DCC family protein [Lysobacter solisilvae]
MAPEAGQVAVVDPVQAADVRATAPDAPAAAVIVFDGVCVLCNGWVHFLLRHDRRARYRFAAMQSGSGRALLDAHGLDPDAPASLLLLEHGRAWTDTDAIVRVIGGLGGAWRCARLLSVLPRPLRNRLYRVLARNRYRWFGRRDACLVPTAEHRHRFLP